MRNDTSPHLDWRRPAECAPFHRERPVLRVVGGDGYRELIDGSCKRSRLHACYSDVARVVVLGAPLSRLSIDHEIDSVLTRDSPQGVSPRGELDAREPYRRRSRELCRGVRPGPPHAIIWYDAADEGASARVWPAVVDGDRVAADGGAHRVARTELFESACLCFGRFPPIGDRFDVRSEEHTSELQSQFHIVCRLLL